MKFILIVFLCLLGRVCLSQEVVVDPATSAAIAINAGIINGQLNTTNNKLDLIQKGQLAVTSQLVIVNNLQNDIYKGLSQVASVVNNLTTIKEIAECGSDIVSDVESSLVLAKSDPVLLLFAQKGAQDFEARAVTLAADVSAFVLKGGSNNLTTIKEIAECGSDIVNDVESSLVLAKSDPVLLLFAQKGAQDFEARAVTLAADVSAFVLKGGSNNLMDSGERGKLLNHIASEMRILRGIAYGMDRAMYWAEMNGIFRSLNPWATWQNEDVQIANSVLNNAKYLKQ